jgi:hypothetical protein
MTDQTCYNGTVDDEPDQPPSFAINPNQAPSRERVLTWPIVTALAFCYRIDVRITRACHKVERELEKPQLIRTMRGDGYMFVPIKPREIAPVIFPLVFRPASQTAQAAAR